MEFANFIQYHHLENLIYVILYAGMMFEGLFFLFSAMFLVTQGVLNPLGAVLVILLGAFTEEMVWYWLGKKLNGVKKVSSWIDFGARRFDKHIIEKPFHTLVISKFVYGIHRAVLTRAGMLNLPFAEFMKLAFLSTAIWLGIMGGAAYGFSSSYGILRRYIHYAEIVPLVAFVLYFVAELIVSKKLKKKL